MERKQDLLYRLWLNLVCGHQPAFIHEALQRFGSAQAVYESDNHLLTSGKNRFKKLLNQDRSLDGAKRLYQKCMDAGIQLLTIDDEEYPQRLRETNCPPQLLYVKGKLPDLDRMVCITIVGTRKYSEAAVRFTQDIAYDLASCGVLIISGMALGGDTAAHKGALKAKRQTVAALAGGVDIIYPKENEALYNTIIQHGAVISEQPPGTTGRSYFYQARNRILAGLSQGTLAVEGDLKSGVALTVNAAKEYNRDIFAVPGAPASKNAKLENALIQDGAKLVLSAEDILEEYAGNFPELLENGLKSLQSPTSPTSPGTPPALYDTFEGTDRIILKYLYDNNGTAHIDDISRDCDIPMAVLNSAMTLLVMRKALIEKPGHNFMLTETT